jgi:Circadian oscillating protein COP23
MNGLFRSIAITLLLTMPLSPSPALAKDKVKVNFFCGRANINGKIIPTTQAISSGMSETISLINWRYPPPPGTTNQQRCEIVSKRFQSAWDRGTFDKLISGVDKNSGLGLICAVTYTEKKCDRANLLFTLSTGSDAEDILNRLRGTISGSAGGQPITQSSGINEIDMQLLIDRLKHK